MSGSISNSGFESIVLEDGGYTFREPVPGWQVYDPSNLLAKEGSNYSTLNPATISFPKEAAKGNNVGAIFLENAPGSGVVGYTQALSDVLTAGKTYTLSVEIGDPLPDEYTGEGFPGYAVQLLAGDKVIAQDHNTQNVLPGTFVTSSVRYMATADDKNLGQPLSIRLLNILEGPGKEVDFDNVRFDITSGDVLNPGFETPVFKEGEFVDYLVTPLPGWELYDPSRVVLESVPNVLSDAAIYHVPGVFFRGGASEGNNILSLGSQKRVGSGIWGVSQKLGKTLQANTTYTFKADVGNIAVALGFDFLEGFPGYGIQLLADGKVIAQDTNSFIPAEGTFQTATVTYTASANDLYLGKNLEIRLLNTMQFPGGETSYEDIRFDVNPAIANSGFEDIVLEDGGYTYRQPVPGWQVYDPSNLLANENSNYSNFNPAQISFPGEASRGANALGTFLDNAPGSGVFGLSQKLNQVLTADTTYTLKVDVGDPLPDEFTGEGFPGYGVQLLAGGQVIAEDLNTKAIDPGTFITSTLTYTASANNPNLGQPLEIRLLNILQGPGKEVDFDNISLESSKLPPGFFNEAYYLESYSDVATSVSTGAFKSGLEHFQRFGMMEGRDLLSPYFNDEAYLARYQDVAQAVERGTFASGVHHFISSGYFESRYSSMSTTDMGDLQQGYFQKYQDVFMAVESGLFQSAYAHYLQFGAMEGRSFFEMTTTP